MSMQEDGIDNKVVPRARPKIVFGESLTKQAFKDQVDINKIVAKYQKTGMVNHLNQREPFYGDVSDIRTYQESLDVVNKAEELFMGMTADVRAKFHNDPAEMVEFLADEKNSDEAVKLGLKTKREPEVGEEQPIKNVAKKGSKKGSEASEEGNEGGSQ